MRKIYWWLLLLLLMVFVLFPFYWMIVSSIKPTPDVLTLNPTLIPKRVTFEHYGFSWYQMNLGRFFGNSFAIAIGTTFLALLLTTPASYALSRIPRGRNLALLVFLLSYIIPPVALLTPLYFVMTKLRLVDTYLAVVLSHATFGIPFCLWLQTTYFDGIPVELDEAACTDGASFLQTMRYVILPVALPGLVVSGLFVFILSWDEFLFAYTFTSSDASRTITAGLFQFIGANIVQWGDLMASATLTTVPIGIIFFLIQKWLIEGLTAGAVKG